MKKIITLISILIILVTFDIPAQTWLDMSTGLGISTESVKAIAVAPNGTIYAGGTFTNANPSLSYLVKWSGTAGEAVGSGVNGPVDGLGIKTSSEVFVGGDFTTAGGVAVNNIAKWSGSAWTDVGGGFNDEVSCIYVSAGTGSVYAGGKFSLSGTTTMNHISKLNGTTWTALGSGISSTVNAIMENNSILYAGTDALSAPVKKFDGSTWSDVAGLSSGKVYALASFNSQLYAGGDFSSPTFAAARYDGTNWNTIVTTFSSADKVYAMLSRFGILYIGGKFSNLGIPGSQSSYAARKMSANNPIQSITATSSTINDEVYAIGNQSGKVIVGGKFTNFNHIAITSTTIGVEEISSIVSGYNFYPNPVSTKANLTVQTTENLKNPELKIFDLQSRIIDNLNIDGITNGNEINFSIDCSSLPKGTYYYLLTEEGKNVLSRQFIVE